MKKKSEESNFINCFQLSVVQNVSISDKWKCELAAHHHQDHSVDQGTKMGL